MSRTISATDARVHFGEVLRRVAEERATYFVERSGSPVAVVISVEEYEALRREREEPYVRPSWLEDVLRVGELWSESRNGKPLDVDRLIEEGREERDAQLLEGLL